MVTPNQAADNVRPASNPLLEAALTARDRGWYVFPCHDVTSGVCSCTRPNCKRPGKHPRIRLWQYEATRDPAKLCHWWGVWPGANVAVRTGRDSGIWVLDVDGPAGVESLTDLELRHGPLPLTLKVMTPRGGWHYYFTYPADRTIRNSQGKLGKGLDVRGEGGYVLVPPSVTFNGTYDARGN